MKLPNILAIDQSFTGSGIVVFIDGSIAHTEVIATTKEDDKFTRTWTISERNHELIDEWDIDHVSLEGIPFQAKGSSTRDLAGLQYVIVTQIKYVAKLPFDIFPPTTVKKTAVGKTKGADRSKKGMFDALPTKIQDKFLAAGYKKTKGLYDVTDAYWIGITTINDIREKYNVCPPTETISEDDIKDYNAKKVDVSDHVTIPALNGTFDKDDGYRDDGAAALSDEEIRTKTFDL